MFTKGFVCAAIASLSFAISLQQKGSDDQVMALAGDLSMPLSVHVGQVSLKPKHDDENCPYIALLEEAQADEAYAQMLDEAQAEALADARQAGYE